VRLAVTLAGPALAGDDALAQLPDLAARADALGIDQLGVPDHVALGADLSAYPYGGFPQRSHDPYPEPLVLLGAVAAVTHRIELCPSTLIVPLRPAALLAKACATLDRVSGGRLVLGAGSGWHEEEFRAQGVPFAGRGRRMDDTLRACRALWRDAPASFTSATVSFADLHCQPRPLAARSIRILVGGGDPARAAARVADYADGWIPPPAPDPGALRDGIAQVREAAADPASLVVKCALPPVGADLARSLDAGVPALVAAGATIVQVAVGAFVDAPAGVPAFLEELVERFAVYR
jgi:probable F420-dependent oxidoreductase